MLPSYHLKAGFEGKIWATVCLNVFTFGLSKSSDIAHLGTNMYRSLQHQEQGDQEGDGGGGGGDQDGRGAEALDLLKGFRELWSQVA